MACFIATPTSTPGTPTDARAVAEVSAAPVTNGAEVIDQAPVKDPTAASSPPCADEAQTKKIALTIANVTIEQGTQVAGTDEEAATQPPEVQQEGLSMAECTTGHLLDTRGNILAATFTFVVIFLTSVTPYFFCASWRCWGGFFTIRKSLCVGAPTAWLIVSVSYSPHRPKLNVLGSIIFILASAQSLFTGKEYNVIAYTAGFAAPWILFVVLPGAFSGNRRGLAISMNFLGMIAQPLLLVAVTRMVALGNALPTSILFVRPYLLPIIKCVYVSFVFGPGQFLAHRYYQKPTCMVPIVNVFAMIIASLEGATLASCLAMPALHEENKVPLWPQVIQFLVGNCIAELSTRFGVPEGLFYFLTARCRRQWQFSPLDDVLRRLKLQVTYMVWPFVLSEMIALRMSHAGDPGNEDIQWAGYWQVPVVAVLYAAHQLATDLIYIKTLRLPGRTLRENWALAMEPGRALPFLGKAAEQQAPAEQADAVEPGGGAPVRRAEEVGTEGLELHLGCYRVPMPVMAVLLLMGHGGSIFESTLAGILGECAMGQPPGLCPE